MKTYTVDMMVASSALEQQAILVSGDGVYLRLNNLEPALKGDNWAEPE